MWIVLDDTQNLVNHGGNQRLATIIFDNRLAAWFAAGSRLRVRTRSANLLLVRTRMRTHHAYLIAYFPCAICTVTAHSGSELSLRLNRLDASRGLRALAKCATGVRETMRENRGCLRLLDAALTQCDLQRLVQYIFPGRRRRLIQAYSAIDKRLAGSHLFEN